jgi:hypothetical protein
LSWPATQRLDDACKRIAEASLVLQLLGALWRLMGQLVAVESLVFVMLRPKLLQQLHKLMAAGAVSLSAALQRLGLTTGQLLPGRVPLGPCCWQMHLYFGPI